MPFGVRLIFTIISFSLLESCSDPFNHSVRTMPPDPLAPTESAPEPTPPIHESFQQTDNTAYHDFLWVFDNSGSMAEERDQARNHMNSFTSTLTSRKAVNYQMAITTTDYFSPQIGEGELISALDDAGNRYDVIHGTGHTPVTYFERLIDSVRSYENSGTSWVEAGLLSSQKALERFGSKFTRPEASLHIVVVSDEDDFSCNLSDNSTPSSRNCDYSLAPEFNPGWNYFGPSHFPDFFKAQRQLPSKTYFHAVVVTPTSRCQTAGIGNRYLAVQQAVGGVSGSICADEMDASLTRIAATIGNLGSCFHLSQPANNTQFQVFIDGTRVTSGFRYDSSVQSVCFDEKITPSNDAHIDISYYPQ